MRYNGQECEIEACHRVAHARGWCKPHYLVWYKHNDPLWVPPTGRRFVNAQGYEMQNYRGHPLLSKGRTGQILTHRVVLYEKIGPGMHQCGHCGAPVEWKKNLWVDHLDENKLNNEPSNLTPSCAQCNVLRAALTRQADRRERYGHKKEAA